MHGFSRFFSRSAKSASQINLQRAPIEPVTLMSRLHDTRVVTSDFEITLPGHWHRVEKPEQLEMVDPLGTQQLIILKWTVPQLSDFAELRQIVQGVATAKLEHVNKISNGHARIMGSNVREVGRQIKVRADAHDPVQQVAITASVQANTQAILSFSLYQTNIPKPDPRARAEAQDMFDSIKLTEV